MAYLNNLLFNNAWLKLQAPSQEERFSAWRFIHSSVRDYLRQADFSTPEALAEGCLRPLLIANSLDISPALEDPHAFTITPMWEQQSVLGLLYVVPNQAGIDGRSASGDFPKGAHWMIRAVDRAAHMGLRWVLLTNGLSWRLLDSAHLRCYEAFLEVDLRPLLQTVQPSEEQTLAAWLFQTLFLSAAALTPDDKGLCGLEVFFTQSQHATDSTERYLKQIVTDNLDTPGGADGIMAQLCLGLVRAVDPDRTRIFSEEERTALYQDATYLLYRLLFLLFAEARGLLPMQNADYREGSLHALVDRAVTLRGSQDGSTRLWSALTRLFDMLEHGDEYFGISAFDGGLFDNAGRSYLKNYPIHNSFLAEALYLLAYEGSPDKRIDYRDLSVRHLGSLYEGMIEYRLYIADQDLLARREKDGRIRFVPGQSGKADEKIPAGQVYFAQNPHERKATGTHYTPEDLVERLVTQTVVRLLDERWAEFQPQLNGWLSELDEIASPERHAAMQHHMDARLVEFIEARVISLRVCDPAMGSGHFLVHTAHRLTRWILHTLTATPWGNPAVDLNPEYWRQRVVEACLYGVDINSMAVELAKLSLWLATMQSGRPLSFLDHRLKCGNSLLGVRFSEIVAALQESDLNRATKKSRIAEEQGQYSFKEVSRAEQAAEEAVRLLDSLVHRDAGNIAGVDAQKQDYRTALERLEAYRKVGNFLVALKLGLKAGEAFVGVVARALERDEFPVGNEPRVVFDKFPSLVADRRVFHWDLEFPDVLLSEHSLRGFDIVIGNPPFLGGLKISSELGSEFLQYLKASFPPSTGGTADLSAYFLHIAVELINQSGYFGFVATNTITQGDTRETGLSVAVNRGSQVIYADRFVKWGGDANVEVNLFALGYISIPLDSHCLLDGIPVPFISTKFDDLPDTPAARLFHNSGKAFIGEYVRGTGFVIDEKEKDYLISKDPLNAHHLRPFLIGKDINSAFDQRTTRWVIDFGEQSIEEVKKYPDLFEILEQRVKPERNKLPPTSSDYIKLRERWWQFARFGFEMRKALSNLKRAMVRSGISEYHALVFVSTDQTISKQLIVFAFDDFSSFAILQSCCHEIWLRRQASTMRTDICYTPTDCFHTFAFPQQPFREIVQEATRTGEAYYKARQDAMFSRQLGLTKTYNRFHDPSCQDADIQHLRVLHAEMDHAVLACYGWQDIDLDHNFYPNDRKKIRFMPSRAAQREIFTRLLTLNQQIAAAEAAEGLSPAPSSEEDDTEELE